jgi:PAS domain S-box-containing protein
MSGQINFGPDTGPSILPTGPAASVSSAAGAVAVAIAYFLAAKLSLALLEEADGVAVFWPAAGIASGILIGLGSAARWPVVAGVMAATIAANLLGDRNIWSSIFFAVANAGEATVAAVLIQRFYGSPFELDGLRHVLGLFAATIGATIASGIVGTLGFALFYRSTASFSTTWFHWFASDALGTITIAPLIIGFASLLRGFPPRREIVEGISSLAVVTGLCAFLILLPNWTLDLAIATLCPLIVWIAARLRPLFTAAATFIIAITIVWTTTYGIGFFGDPRLSIDQRILSAQATILAISFGALILAALFSERRLHEIALLEREARLQDALRAGGVLAFDWDLPADEVRHSQNATQTLGIESKQILSSAVWLKQIHPDDRPRVVACLHGLRPHNPSYSTTFRYMRQDGDREVWLEQIAIADFDPAGQLKRVQGLTTDITERKRYEQEISRAQKSAELANQGKSSFLAAASHDLRGCRRTQALRCDRALARYDVKHVVELARCQSARIWKPAPHKEQSCDQRSIRLGNNRFFAVSRGKRPEIARRTVWTHGSQRQAHARGDDPQYSVEFCAIYRSGKTLAGLPTLWRQYPYRNVGQRHWYHGRSAASYIR